MRQFYLRHKQAIHILMYCCMLRRRKLPFISLNTDGWLWYYKSCTGSHPLSSFGQWRIQDFPGVMAPTPKVGAQTYYFGKLHDIEKIRLGGGGVFHNIEKIRLGGWWVVSCPWRPPSARFATAWISMSDKTRLLFLPPSKELLFNNRKKGKISACNNWI